MVDQLRMITEKERQYAYTKLSNMELRAAIEKTAADLGCAPPGGDLIRPWEKVASPVADVLTDHLRALCEVEELRARSVGRIVQPEKGE